MFQHMLSLLTPGVWCEWLQLNHSHRTTPWRRERESWMLWIFNSKYTRLNVREREEFDYILTLLILQKIAVICIHIVRSSLSTKEWDLWELEAFLSLSSLMQVCMWESFVYENMTFNKSLYFFFIWKVRVLDALHHDEEYIRRKKCCCCCCCCWREVLLFRSHDTFITTIINGIA